MARRTKEDAEKTRTALLDAAEQVFLRRGVAAATLNEIAKEAGVTRGAVYWHFEDKIAIFTAMHERVKLPIDMLYEELTSGPDPVDGLKSLCIRVLESVGRDEHTRNVFTILRLRCDDKQDPSYALDIAQKREHALGRFEKIFAGAALIEGMTPRMAALGLHSYFSGILWDYLHNPQHYPITTLAPSLVNIYFRGLLRA